MRDSVPVILLADDLPLLGSPMGFGRLRKRNIRVTSAARAEAKLGRTM